MADAIEKLIPRRIWDLPLRLFHWTLVLSVSIAGLTGFLFLPVWLALHLVAGTLITALVLFRLVWGFAGSTFSRFKSFWYSPQATMSYARAQWQGRTQTYLGHNPLGAAMIFAMFIMITLITITGLATLGGVDKQGPLRALVSYAAGQDLRGLHQAAAITLLVMIGGHLAGVIFETIRERINLARAMVTGLKPAPAHLAIDPPRHAMALLGLPGLGLVTIGPLVWLWQAPPFGAPQAALDAAYVQACSDCHIPFHPSLRSAASWAAIMADLGHHFGEDAELKPTEATAIAAYLAANSAEHWDTRAAHEIARVNTADPLRITAGPFWTRRHGGIDPAVFKSDKVKAKDNCEACHGDARQGLFMPQAIHIP